MKALDPQRFEKVKAGEIAASRALKEIKLEKAKREYTEARQQTATKPHFERADAIAWLDQQPECDLLLTDPPYCTDIEGDILNFAKSWLPLALKKVKPTGRAYVFIGAYPQEVHAYLSVAMPTQILIWTYTNTIGPKAELRYQLNYQVILYYCGPKAQPLNTPLLTERLAVHDIPAPDGRHGNRIHPWQKPDALAERLILHATNPGDLVLDPFCGSGTFVYAAARLGRIGRGCDKEGGNTR
ncbi:MAG: site-specific DNA-methyltransferase [Planctomycetota bacterium]|nr:site-specific DNA-methyltransferase [Planctomycetota bacterium]